MQRTFPTLSLLRSRLTRARRGHGGTAQAQRALARLALLEQATLTPAELRGRQKPAATEAATAAYLRELPARVEEVRAAAVSSFEGATPLMNRNAGGVSAGAQRSDRGAEPQVSNLTQFLAQCKRLKIRYSSDKDAAMRLRSREALCSFWSQHATSAVACCYEGVREVGFVADYGLADTGMHLDLPGMWTMLRVLKAESAVASSVDATRTLQYLARELQYLERGVSQGSHRRRNDSPLQPPRSPSSSELGAFRQALTSLALDLLAFYFVVHNPAVLPADAAGRTPAAVSAPPATKAAIATAADALSGLEVLAVVSATDAAPETIASVWEERRLWALRRQREPVEVAAAVAAQVSASFPLSAAAASSSAALGQEVQHLLVAELLRFVAMQRRDLRMTDVVHGFALLRVHLRTLWPPYARTDSRANAGSAAHTMQEQAEGPRRSQLWYEKDTLFRVTWGLAVALVSKDRRLVSSYHYVKIVTTLAKLPAFVLSPEPDLKKELRRLTLTRGTGPAGQETVDAEDAERQLHEQRFLLSETPPEQRAHASTSHTNSSSGNNVSDGATVALRPAEFWRFIVSKACVFVPNLPPDQRRVVCRSLHLAVTEKRGQLLRDAAGDGKGSRLQRQTKLERRVVRSGFGRPAAYAAALPADAAMSGEAADILRPLVEEMSTYAETYDACIAEVRRGGQYSHQRRR